MGNHLAPPSSVVVVGRVVGFVWGILREILGGSFTSCFNSALQNLPNPGEAAVSHPPQLSSGSPATKASPSTKSRSQSISLGTPRRVGLFCLVCFGSIWFALFFLWFCFVCSVWFGLGSIGLFLLVWFQIHIIMSDLVQSILHLDSGGWSLTCYLWIRLVALTVLQPMRVM